MPGADPKLSVYFAGGREIVIDTSEESTTLTIGKNDDGSYTIQMKLIVASATAKNVIGNFEDLVIPKRTDGTDGTFEDLKNILYLEKAYTVDGAVKTPVPIKPKVVNFTLSVLPQGGGTGAPFKMLFDLRFFGGGKTDHGGIKTDHGGVGV